MNIPKSHPRFVSLSIREKIVKGYNDGLVAKEGLLAHGRGEAFDYLVGEKTTKTAKAAIKAAAVKLLSAQNPVISVNGNVAALCPKEIVQLAKATKAKIVEMVEQLPPNADLRLHVEGESIEGNLVSKMVVIPMEIGRASCRERV